MPFIGILLGITLLIFWNLYLKKYLKLQYILIKCYIVLWKLQRKSRKDNDKKLLETVTKAKDGLGEIIKENEVEL